jgi:hypothetical protein
MTAVDRVLVSLAIAALVVAPCTGRAGESEDADRALFIKYCAAWEKCSPPIRSTTGSTSA